MTPQAPLRIAILLDPDHLVGWQFRMLEKIQTDGTGQVVLAIQRGTDNDDPPPEKKTSLALRLFYRYLMWDRKKFSEYPMLEERRELVELNDSITSITMSPETNHWVDRLSEADAHSLREHDIDVVIRLGWRILRGEILTIPRYGVWSFHQADNRINRGGPPAVWEHFNRQLLTGLTLQILNEELDNGLVIARSTTATDRSSAHKTRNKLKFRSMDMLPRKLAEMHCMGFEKFTQQARDESTELNFYSHPLLTEKQITPAQSLRYIWINFTNYIKLALFMKFMEETWALYFKLGEDVSTSIWQFTKIAPPKDRYYADPHIIKRNGIFYVFAEEFNFHTHRGSIVVIPIHEDGTVEAAQPVLEADYHLSYPFIFEDDDELYMIPESCANRTIDLYRCVSFPDKWEHVKTMMDNLVAVDTTLHYVDGRWWMFTNRCDNGSVVLTHDELFVYHAKHFLDDHWIPHRQEVVVSDVRTARPAGALFNYHGKLYRPAQDCSVDYGYALQMHEVVTLTEDEYKETPVSRITPNWDPDVAGVHSFGYVPGLTVIDAKVFLKKRDIKKALMSRA